MTNLVRIWFKIIKLKKNSILEKFHFHKQQLPDALNSLQQDHCMQEFYITSRNKLTKNLRFTAGQQAETAIGSGDPWTGKIIPKLIAKHLEIRHVISFVFPHIYKLTNRTSMLSILREHQAMGYWHIHKRKQRESLQLYPGNMEAA